MDEWCWKCDKPRAIIGGPDVNTVITGPHTEALVEVTDLACGHDLEVFIREIRI